MGFYIFNFLSVLFENTIIAHFISIPFKETKWKYSKYVLIVVLVCEAYILNNSYDLAILVIILPVLTCYIYSIFFLNGSKIKKIYTSILPFLSIVMISALILISNNITGREYAFTVVEFEEMISFYIMVVVSKVLFYIVYKIAQVVALKDEFLGKNDWKRLLVVPLCSFISVILMIMYSFEFDIRSNIFLMINVFIYLVMNYVNYKIYKSISITNKHIIDHQISKNEAEYNKKVLNDLNIAVENNRKLKHDLKNHYGMIESYIENNDKEMAIEYLNNLNEKLNDITIITTGNQTLDYLINSKFNGIDDIQLRLVFTGNIDFMNKLDIVTIFGNLLDNAIEAQINIEDKYVFMEVSLNNDETIIRIINPIGESVLNENRLLKSTKINKEQHGIGLRSVKECVDKYNGVIDFKEDELKFIVEIRLKKTIRP